MAGTAVALALGVSVGACGETASTSSFKGESHNVAQTISNFQTDVTAREQKKLCERDLAATVAGRLARSGGSCQAALKNQLVQIDATGLTIEAIAVNGKKATARVKSTYSGKSAISALTLVNEGGHWKISGTTAVHVAPAPKKG